MGVIKNGIINSKVLAALEQAISCGYCGEITTVRTECACIKCGRVLCPLCDNRWSFCKDHIPVCYHPELVPTAWNQPRPEPTKMIGPCKHNMTCPICGFGWGCAPDPCDNSEDALLVASGLLPRLTAEALQESSSPDWERELEEM